MLITAVRNQHACKRHQTQQEAEEKRGTTKSDTHVDTSTPLFDRTNTRVPRAPPRQAYLETNASIGPRKARSRRLQPSPCCIASKHVCFSPRRRPQAQNHEFHARRATAVICTPDGAPRRSRNRIITDRPNGRPCAFFVGSGIVHIIGNEAVVSRTDPLRNAHAVKARRGNAEVDPPPMFRRGGLEQEVPTRVRGAASSMR